MVVVRPCKPVANYLLVVLLGTKFLLANMLENIYMLAVTHL
jgi:hypothetical protein